MDIGANVVSFRGASIEDSCIRDLAALEDVAGQHVSDILEDFTEVARDACPQRNCSILAKGVMRQDIVHSDDGFPAGHPGEHYEVPYYEVTVDCPNQKGCFARKQNLTNEIAGLAGLSIEARKEADDVRDEIRKEAQAEISEIRREAIERSTVIEEAAEDELDRRKREIYYPVRAMLKALRPESEPIQN